INAILWKRRTGAPWRDLPERYGPWKTAPVAANNSTRINLTHKRYTVKAIVPWLPKWRPRTVLVCRIAGPSRREVTKPAARSTAAWLDAVAGLIDRKSTRLNSSHL